MQRSHDDQPDGTVMAWTLVRHFSPAVLPCVMKHSGIPICRRHVQPIGLAAAKKLSHISIIHLVVYQQEHAMYPRHPYHLPMTLRIPMPNGPMHDGSFRLDPRRFCPTQKDVQATLTHASSARVSIAWVLKPVSRIVPMIPSMLIGMNLVWARGGKARALR